MWQVTFRPYTQSIDQREHTGTTEPCLEGRNVTFYAVPAYKDHFLGERVMVEKPTKGTTVADFPATGNSDETKKLMDELAAGISYHDFTNGARNSPWFTMPSQTTNSPSGYSMNSRSTRLWRFAKPRSP